MFRGSWWVETLLSLYIRVTLGEELANPLGLGREEGLSS